MREVAGLPGKNVGGTIPAAGEGRERLGHGRFGM